MDRNLPPNPCNNSILNTGFCPKTAVLKTPNKMDESNVNNDTF